MRFEDFKGRFTFVMIDNDGVVVKENPLKNFSDVLACHYSIDYGKIDDEDFISNIHI